MDIRLDLNNLKIFKQPEEQQQNAVAKTARAKSKPTEIIDSVSLSSGQNGTGTTAQNNKTGAQNGLLKSTRLISEETTLIENGFRRTQSFEGADGRKFTRTEEFTINTDRARRVVIQQNNSGSITRSEEILDRQEDGNFRLTQYFVNSEGEKQTNITFDVIPTDPDIILGRPPKPDSSNEVDNISRGDSFDKIV